MENLPEKQNLDQSYDEKLVKTIQFLQGLIKQSKQRQKELAILKKKFQDEYPEIFK